jgi:hypothetical protein
VRALGEGDEAGADIAGVADAMHALLVKRADQLASSIGGDADVTEYLSIVATIMAYEGKRWPSGKVPGGKG